jgi:hypothetical protein
MRVAGAVGIGALLCWLGFSENPTDRRIKQLNELISSGKLADTPPVIHRRLEIQFEWLARHAGVKSKIVTNGLIEPHQLTLIVTTPAVEDATHCGTGNALYDPTINTIFIDISLVWPTEVNVIGTKSVNAMFTPEDLEYVASYTNFILAHELGHWQAHSKEAAFFYYGWNDGGASLPEEEAADESAVRTLLAAGIADDEPASLRSINSLTAFGFGHEQLSPIDRIGADMLGGIINMSYDLLFSSSPYSPYTKSLSV